MLPIVCWAANPMIAARTAVEARMPVATRFSSVNWASAIAARTTKTTRTRRRGRKRSGGGVERETCETAGVMEAKLAVGEEERQPSRRFPYSNWGPVAGVLGMLLAIGPGLVLGALLAIPAFISEERGEWEVSSAANALTQLGAEIAFVMVPMLIAARRGASAWEALRRLGIRRFRPSAGLWMLAAAFAYLVCAAVYVALAGEPEQEDIAEGFGVLPVQILLIVIAVPIGEEICFRGFVFGGLRAGGGARPPRVRCVVP